MSDEPYWEVTLPTKHIVVKGNWTRQQAQDAILNGLSLFIEENLSQSKPKPDLPEGITIDFVEKEIEPEDGEEAGKSPS